MRIIRASEIGIFCYCHRAWWYHISGIEAGNQFELIRGQQHHYRHNIHVIEVKFLRYFGYFMIIISIGIIIVYAIR